MCIFAYYLVLRTTHDSNDVVDLTLLSGTRFLFKPNLPKASCFICCEAAVSSFIFTPIAPLWKNYSVQLLS